MPRLSKAILGVLVVGIGNDMRRKAMPGVET
jgi:hypothetical protein